MRDREALWGSRMEGRIAVAEGVWIGEERGGAGSRLQRVISAKEKLGPFKIGAILF